MCVQHELTSQSSNTARSHFFYGNLQNICLSFSFLHVSSEFLHVLYLSKESCRIVFNFQSRVTNGIFSSSAVLIFTIEESCWVLGFFLVEKYASLKNLNDLQEDKGSAVNRLYLKANSEYWLLLVS